MAFLWVTLACSLSIGGPTPPGLTITPAHDNFDIKAIWSQAYAQAQNGQWIVILNEAQLTAYLENYLLENPDTPLRQPQVFLRDGTINVYGQYQSDYLSASVLIFVKPTVREDGTVDWKVEDAQVGPAHLPSGMLTAISTTISETLSGQNASIATGFRIVEVLIGDGQIAIRCHATT